MTFNEFDLDSIFKENEEIPEELIESTAGSEI